MFDYYISDFALQTLSQLLVTGVYIFVVSTHIEAKMKLFILAGVVYTLVSIGLIYDIDKSIAVTIVFCIFALIINRFQNRFFILCATVVYLCVNNISLVVHSNQETLFYTMLKLMALECVFFAYHLFVICKRKEYLKNALFFQIIVFALCFGTGSLLIANNQYMKLGMRDILYFPVWVISVLYIVVSLLFDIFVNSLEMQQKLKLQKLKNEMVNRQYHTLKQKYQDISILKHDTKHHLQTLSILLYQKEIEKANEYIQKFSDYMNENSLVYSSTNQILEIVINEKYLEAKAKGIDMEIHCEDVNIDFVDEVDIITIFANILDNAIEAVEFLENEKKIMVTMVKRNHYIVFEVINYFDWSIRKNNHQLQSTKKGHDGLGVISVRKAVDKYQGIAKFEDKENIFTATIFFPVKF